MGVAPNGLPNLEELIAAITPETILIAAMYANNETGVLQPIREIGALAKKHKVLFFTDATQAVGKVPVDVREANIDLLALSAHKIYGPKGVGALYVRRKSPRVSLAAQIDGGGHERGFRSGTLNVPGIVGLGVACKRSKALMGIESERLRALRNTFEHWVLQQDGASINGGAANRLAHVSNFSLPTFTGSEWVSKLNNELAFSVGSACSSAANQPSHVLQAMGLPERVTNTSLRFSMGASTTAAALKEVQQQLEKLIAGKVQSV